MTTIPFVGAVGEDVRDAWLTHLQAALPAYRIVPFDGAGKGLDADVAIVANPDPPQLMQMPNLKWVQSLWAGVETLLETLPQNIAIVRMTDPQLARTMAEAVLTMTLFLHRDLPRYAAQQTAGIWAQHPVPLPQERSVGILGLGALGRAAAASLSDHGFNVLGWSASPKSITGVRCFSGEHGLTEVLRGADTLVVLLPLTDDTRHLLDARRMSGMKRGASLINFARAQIVETGALVKLLESGHLYHAILDVFDEEPLPRNNKLWRCKNLTILPHVAAPTNMKTASAIVADHLQSYFRTGLMPACVDRAAGY